MSFIKFDLNNLMRRFNKNYEEWKYDWGCGYIFNYFKTAETDSVEDAQKDLGENDYTLDEIRMMRIKFMSELGN